MSQSFTTMNIHNVDRIELSSSYPSNSNSRTLRIVSGTHEFEITVYGKTDALDALAKANDFVVHQGEGILA